jgi:hypothetical protein
VEQFPQPLAAIWPNALFFFAVQYFRNYTLKGFLNVVAKKNSMQILSTKEWLTQKIKVHLYGNIILS